MPSRVNTSRFQARVFALAVLCISCSRIRIGRDLTHEISTAFWQFHLRIGTPLKPGQQFATFQWGSLRPLSLNSNKSGNSTPLVKNNRNMQYESTGAHGVRRSISIANSKVTRGLTQFYYKGQLSIFVEDNFNSVRIKVHKTMLDAMLTLLKFWDCFPIRTTKTQKPWSL